MTPGWVTGLIEEDAVGEVEELEVEEGVQIKVTGVGGLEVVLEAEAGQVRYTGLACCAWSCCQSNPAYSLLFPSNSLDRGRNGVLRRKVLRRPMGQDQANLIASLRSLQLPSPFPSNPGRSERPDLEDHDQHVRIDRNLIVVSLNPVIPKMKSWSRIMPCTVCLCSS